MRFWLHLLFLVAALEGARSQVVLTQSGPEIKKPGESTQLKCAVSGFAVSSYYMAWFRQEPGKGLEWLVSYHTPSSTNYYSDSIKGRFTASKDSSNFYLHMTGLRPQDTAVYYCARVRGGFNWAAFEHWGQGTLVTVTSVSATAPSVFPLTSCTGEVTTSQVTFGCLAKGYFPEPVTVTWSPNVGSSGVRTYPSVLQPSGDLYSLSSQVTVPATSWESNTYRCTVEHQPTSSSSSKEIPKPPKPKVELFYSCTTDSGVIQAVCLISHFNSADLRVQWIVNSQTIDGDIDPPTKDANGHTFSTRSRFTPTNWTGDLVCQVFQPGSTTPTQAYTHKCKG